MEHFTGTPGTTPQDAKSGVAFTAALLQGVLSARRIPAMVVPAWDGPQVQTFTVSLALGERPEAVEKLSGALALAAGCESCRVSTAGGRLVLELAKPEAERRTLRAGKLEDLRPPSSTAVAIGVGIDGRAVWCDIADSNSPHLLVAGTTGSGKTAAVKWFLYSLVRNNAPVHRPRLLMIDPKRTELSEFSRLPHLLHPVTSSPVEIGRLLAWCAGELSRRLASGRQGVSRLVLVVEELPDVVQTVPGAAEILGRVLQVGRTVGLHVLATAQQPGRAALGPGLHNFPARLVGRVASQNLVYGATGRGRTGVGDLLGRGDMVYLSAGVQARLQVPLVESFMLASLPHVDEVPSLEDELPLPVVLGDRARDRRGGAGRRELSDEDYRRIAEALAEGASPDELRELVGIGYGRAKRIYDEWRES